jgi:hypothetical protein
VDGGECGGDGRAVARHGCGHGAATRGGDGDVKCWFPTPLHKGVGKLIRRAGPRGTVRRRGMPLMTMLPPGGANWEASPCQPLSARQRCW